MTSYSDHSLKLQLLGGFDVSLNGDPLTDISYNKMRALLAYLAMEQEQDHRRDVLAETFWPNNDPATARGNLRRTLSQLRRALELSTGSPLFSTQKHTIRFIPNIYVDALDFINQATDMQENSGVNLHQEQRLISLYRGEFLAGLSLPDSPYFEDWLCIQRETMHGRAIALLEQLAKHYAQAGNYGNALNFALRHTELEPWNEDAHCRTMRFYALNGQNSAAIHQYETCCRLLKNELDTVPNQETQQLAEYIRNGKLSTRSTDTAQTSTQQLITQAAEERRQATVLYCEFTAETIDDPDETMELLSAPKAHCIALIKQFSGHIAPSQDSGVLAYFGYPQAHEDAARRAVQAALAVTCKTERIEIRASIHTGLIITDGEPSRPDKLGKISRLATQLHHGLESGVLISQATYNIVSGYFDCLSLGSYSMRGYTEPLELFKVLQESDACCRLDSAAQLTPFTGRQAELDILERLWQKAAQGIRQVVLVQGEAGIGKSRLLHALKQRLVGQPHTLRKLRCFQEHSRSPFHPLISMLETVIGFSYDDTTEAKFAKVVKYVESHYPGSKQDAVHVLTQLLSLNSGDQYQSSNSSPQKHKELTCAILLAALKTLSEQQPVLLIVEDLHWIDPSTLELLTLLVEQKEQTAILVAITARPEFVPPWQENLASILTLTALAKDDAIKMATSINPIIPAAIIRRIVERADGIPLFVEEITKIAEQDNPASIPASLRDLLTVRLDKLGDSKYTAQCAATIGRDFDLALLHRIYPGDPEALKQNLSVLHKAGLILKLSETVYQFKHKLIQEAAYQSQTKANRQAVHRHIAQVLQSDLPALVTTQPEHLAHHLSEGGEKRQAVEFWLKAGQRAALNSANLEAIDHFNNGLRDLLNLPPNPERDHLESELHAHLKTALIAAKQQRM